MWVVEDALARCFKVMLGGGGWWGRTKCVRCAVGDVGWRRLPVTGWTVVQTGGNATYAFQSNT